MNSTELASRSRATIQTIPTTDEAIGAELWRFSAAVRQRFGNNAERAMVRSGGGFVGAASVPRQHHVVLAAVSWTASALKEGEHASQAEAACLTHPLVLGYRRGLKP